MNNFRSEDMGLYSLSVEKNFAWDVMDSLGKLSCLEFIDVNKKEQVYSRPYSTMIRRCDEAMRRLRYIEAICAKYNKSIRKPSSVDSFLTNLQQTISSQGMDAIVYFEKLEQTLADSEKFFIEQLKEAEVAYSKYIAIAQHRYALNKASEVVLSRAK